MKQFILLVLVSLYISNPVFAHVVVKPSQVPVGSWQSFVVGVPNEKNNATVSIRLVIPSGLEHVTPNVKPGWQIEMLKQDQGSAHITEIIWTQGIIPVGQRDDFVFSAKVPTKESVLQWKAYQTYEDGTIVSWDQSQQAEKIENSGPYSETNIVDDLKVIEKNNTSFQKQDIITEWIPYIAFILSGTALILTLIRTKK